MPVARRTVLAGVLAGIVAAALLVTLVVVLVTRDDGEPDPCAALPPVSGGASGRPFVGTLGTHADTAADESRAGIKMAMIEIGWRNLEPREGRFDTGYAHEVCRRVAALRDAGMQVTLGLGLHYTPQWVLDRNGSRYVDQNGDRSDQVDLVFNNDMRRLAERYVTEVDELIGLQHFWAVRVTGGGNSEVTYPAGNTYWAYSDGAQNGRQRPATLAANPVPGFRPGDTDVSVEDRGRWLRWYVSGLSDVVDWQSRTLRGLGFDGYLQVVTPGQGIRPRQIAGLVDKGLPAGLLARGVVWSWVYGGLQVRDAVTAYVSSVADGSGNDDGCDPADADVSLDTKAVLDWSAARWITRIAREQGFTVAGEAPGYRDSAKRRDYYADTSRDGLAVRAYEQARGCGFLGLYWAHDDQVRDGTVSREALGRLAGPNPVAPAPVSR